LIGAGQLSRYVAEMARLLDFEVLICDPREEFVYGWEEQHGRFVPGMPDEAVLNIQTDERTAIVCLTHDPRLDDMALLTALNSSAFYIGALGSRVNTQKRRENLAALGLAGVGFEAVKMASKFDSEMSLMVTQAGVGEEKLDGLKKGVLGIAAKVGTDPDSLAEALFHVESNFESMGITSEKALKLTETAAIASFSQANRFIHALKELGCRFALDDFGTGLSSFGYLKHFPVDFLKIDGSFVKEILHDPIDREMVRSINEIGHLTGKLTIAEFAENAEIIQMLRSLGVDYAQGYGISQPQRVLKSAVA